jgi:hypothetical protein
VCVSTYGAHSNGTNVQIDEHVTNRISASNVLLISFFSSSSSCFSCSSSSSPFSSKAFDDPYQVGDRPIVDASSFMDANGYATPGHSFARGRSNSVGSAGTGRAGRRASSAPPRDRSVSVSMSIDMEVWFDGLECLQHVLSMSGLEITVD